MSTYSQHQGTAARFGERAKQEATHPVTTVIGVIVGAVVVGALVGLLLASIVQGPATAQVHRAGAHGKAAILQDTHRVAAGAQTQAQSKSSAEGFTTARTVIVRSPARGGFAVGRTFDVGGAAANTQGPSSGSGSQP